MTSFGLGDPWLAFGVGVFILAVLAVVVIGRREQRPAPSTNAKLDELSTRMAAAEEKQKLTDHDVRNIRMVVNNLPTKDSIAALSNQVAESRGQIGGMQTTLIANSRALDRIEDFLLRAAGDAIVSTKPGKEAKGDQT